MKRAIVLLALLASTSFGQIPLLTNVFLRANGIRLGTATNREEGSLRFATNELQLFRNGEWGNIKRTNDLYWSDVSNTWVDIIYGIGTTASNALPRSGGLMTGNIDFTNAGLTSLDFLNFDPNPTNSLTTNQLQWYQTRSTLRFGLNNNVNMELGQQLMLYAKNVETNTISRGEVVYLNGATGDNPTCRRASNTEEAKSARTIGIAAEDITVNNNGFIVTRGTVYNVNTTNFTEGAALYLGANGTLQTNLPTAPLNGVFVGVAEKINKNAGQIYVAVQNYQELSELSDVYINNPSNNQVLVYVSSSNRWENQSVPAALIAGITATSAYRGDWGDYVSNRADNAFNLAVLTSNNFAILSNSVSNAQFVASNALRRSGDTYGGSFDAYGYNITNINVLSASNFVVRNIIATNVTVYGFLNVYGTQSIFQTIYYYSNVYYAATQYIGTVYQTNYQTVYQTTIVYTNYQTTNNITTIINYDGQVNYTNANYVWLPHLRDYRDTAAYATGLWDFTGATVTGLNLGGGTITNAYGTGLLYLGVSGASITGGLSSTVATNGQWMADVLQYGGSTSRFNFVTTTTNFNGKFWDFIFADTTAASVTVTLPKASANTNAPLVTKKVAVGNLLLIGAQSGDTVEGTNEIGLSVSGNMIELISDGGTNWWVR